MATRVVKPMAKQVRIAEERGTGFITFGEANLFPQTLLDVIDDSNTASAAMSVRAEFIEGNGLADKTLSEMKVNRKGQVLDDIIAASAWNIATGEVICLHVTYNGLLQITGLQSIPWELIRFTRPDDEGAIVSAGIFPYLNSTLHPKRQKEHRKVFLYNPNPDVVAAQIASVGGIEHYYGQLLYVPAGRASGTVYHMPSYAGGTAAFETEKELGTFDYRTVTTDFAVGGFIKALKPATTTQRVQREDGSFVDERIETLADRVTQFQGAENASSIFVAEADTQAELDSMEFVPITGAQQADRYKSTVERTQDSILTRTRVPGELSGRRRTGGIAPTGDEIRVASQLMQQTVNRFQRTLTRTLTGIFANWHEPITDRDFTLENLNYFPDDTTSTDGTSMAQPN